jgi:hypothetical protein
MPPLRVASLLMLVTSYGTALLQAVTAVHKRNSRGGLSSPADATGKCGMLFGCRSQPLPNCKAGIAVRKDAALAVQKLRYLKLDTLACRQTCHALPHHTTSCLDGIGVQHVKHRCACPDRPDRHLFTPGMLTGDAQGVQGQRPDQILLDRALEHPAGKCAPSGACHRYVSADG